MTTPQADALACVRCGREVVRNRDKYETFERMHYACFHYEFEHMLGEGPETGDPDIACRDPSCPARSFDDRALPDWYKDGPISN